MYPHRSRVTFEDPPSCLQEPRRSRPENFDTFPSFTARSYEGEEDANPFGPQSYSRASYRLCDRGINPSTPAHTYEVMRRWNIKYSGACNDDPDAFLMRIKEGRELVPVSDENLLRVIPFFLLVIALSWFRVSKHLWRTFNQFAKAFRVRFGDSDFQFELRQEIHLRIQGERESVSCL